MVLPEVAAALVWGFVAAAGLLVGGVVGIRADPSPEWVGRVMAFGAGTLVAAVTLDLTLEAVDVGGEPAFLAGLLAGGLTFYFADRALLRDEARGMGPAESITLGSLLDGIPESAAIGLTIAAQGRVPVALVVAAFIGNLPEGLGPSVMMVRNGRSKGWVVRLWLGIAVASAVSAVLGYALLSAMPPSVDAVVQAFAAGAILAMLSMTLMPEAFERAGRLVGVWTVVGYAIAAIIATSTA
jgi:ZIP family zinc transporter